MGRSIAVTGIVCCMLVAGCSVHTVERSPQLDMNTTAAFSLASSKPAQNLPVWYTAFNDPQLAALIDQALKNNYDLKQSLARLKQARAIARISESAGLPTLNLEASGTHRFEKDRTRNTYQAGLAFGWEVDLFDRLENAELADAMETLARMEDTEALRLSLGSEVALAYYGALAARQKLDLLKEQVRLDTHYLDLVMLRFQNGVGTSVEILQQKSQLSASESLIPSARAELRTYENRLDTLLGEIPDGKDRLVKSGSLLDVPMPKAVGVPSELLTHRPDLRAQQRRLVAADAGIGAAIAGRLPSLTLGASYYQTESLTYSGPLGLLSASLLQPLLDWGARKAEVSRNRAVYEEQLAAYGALYLQAMEEVENTLYQEAQQRDYLKRLEERRAVLQLTVDETQAQYLQGISDYLPVLTALEALHETERSLITARYNLLAYRITLYRALGSPTGLAPTPPKESGS